MDIKKIGITGVSGFVSTAIMGGILTALFYQKHMTGVADKFPGIVQFPPDVASATIGMVVTFCNGDYLRQDGRFWFRKWSYYWSMVWICKMVFL